MSRGKVYMDKICGIYIIKNKVNDKVYIGQSVNIVSRWYAHKQSAQNINAQDHYTKIHQAMYNYGVENFYYEILEECPLLELDSKEIYYISQYNSYPDGYNMTLGGEGNKYETNGRAILKLEQVQEIRLMYGAKIRFKDAYKRYEGIISKRGFKKVWHYETWLGVLPEVYTDENKRWHATVAKRHIDGNLTYGKNNSDRSCSQEEIEKMRTMRSQGLSYEQIGEEVNRSLSVVRKYCLHREAKNPQALGKSQPHSISVRNIETGLVFESSLQASKWAGVKDRGKRIRQLTSSNNRIFTSGTVPSTGERCHWESA